MPLKRKYTFEVTVEHVGPEKDFDWFFSCRRSKAEVTLVSSNVETEELAPDSEEVAPKLREKKAKSFIKAALKKAGLNIVKSDWYYRKDEAMPDYPVVLYKSGESFSIQSPGNYNRLQLRYTDKTLTHTFKKYKVVDGGLGVEDFDHTETFIMDDPKSMDRLVKRLKVVFLKEKSDE